MFCLLEMLSITWHILFKHVWYFSFYGKFKNNWRLRCRAPWHREDVAPSHFCTTSRYTGCFYCSPYPFLRGQLFTRLSHGRIDTITSFNYVCNDSMICFTKEHLSSKSIAYRQAEAKANSVVHFILPIYWVPLLLETNQTHYIYLFCSKKMHKRNLMVLIFAKLNGFI